MSALALLENTCDIDAYLKLRNEVPELEVIATSPGVCWELETRGIAYQSIASYWDKTLLTQIGMDNFRYVEELCTEVDHALQDRYPLLREYGLSPAMDNSFYVKLLYDAFTLRIVVLSNILEQHGPDEVLTFTPYTENHPHEGAECVPFRENESIFSQILGLDGWDTISRVISRDNSSPESPGSDSRRLSRKLLSEISAAISGNSLLYNFLYCAKNIGWRSAFTVALYALKNHFFSDKRLLLIGFAYNWNYIIPDLYRNGFSVYHYGLEQASGFGVGEPLEIPESIFQKYCTIKDINFVKPFQQRFLPRLNESIVSSPHNVDSLEEVIKKSNPKAMLFGTKSWFAEHLAACVARSHDIPVISWQHGSQGVNYAPIALHVEVRNSDIYLCFGWGVEDTFREDLTRYPSVKTIPVGSHELFMLHQRKFMSTEPVAVLYATTSYYNNNVYVSSPSILQDNELWQTQKKILDTLGEIGINTVFKLHPASCNDEHILQFLTKRAYSNILAVKRERSYLELLADENIVIIDFPSTTLLQAVAAHKTVFVLLKHLKITDVAENLLRNRAYCYDSVEELTVAIQRYLAKEPLDQHPDSENTEFIEAYGVSQIGGTIADRVIAVLDRLN